MGRCCYLGILRSKSYGDEKLTVIYREENAYGRPGETSRNMSKIILGRMK